MTVNTGQNNDTIGHPINIQQFYMPMVRNDTMLQRMKLFFINTNKNDHILGIPQQLSFLFYLDTRNALVTLCNNGQICGHIHLNLMSHTNMMVVMPALT